MPPFPRGMFAKGQFRTREGSAIDRGAPGLNREEPLRNGSGLRAGNGTVVESLDSVVDARVSDGLYSIAIEMSGAKSGHATGVAVLHDGRILGGDSFFYYTGSYSHGRGKWRGEMIVHQHTDAPGLNLVFGGREVTCGFSGSYSGGAADIDGTALVGSFSIPFRARLMLKSAIQVPHRSSDDRLYSLAAQNVSLTGSTEMPL